VQRRTFFAVHLNLILHRIESRKVPKISRLGIVVSLRVPSFIGLNKLVELMDDKENGLKLARVSHKGTERVVSVIFILIVAKA
jgi:hypothetical protein